jgi:hypothetical protein
MEVIMKFKPGDKASLNHEPNQKVIIVEYFKDTEDFNHISLEEQNTFKNHIIFFYIGEGEQILVDKISEEELTLN